jgi:hypothetical protein
MKYVTDENFPDEFEVPQHRNFLVYCDESGIDGQRYYGFGSLWMPWERRGDFCALVRELRKDHRYDDEIKWQHVNKRSVAFCCDLLDAFFAHKWLMFHALIVRKGYSYQVHVSLSALGHAWAPYARLRRLRPG